MKPCVLRILMAFAVLIVALAAPAERYDGPVNIVVKDEAGQPVSGATVQCTNWYNIVMRTEPLAPNEQATTNAEGRVTFEGIPRGPFNEVFIHVVSGELGGWFRVQDREPEAALIIRVGNSIQITVNDITGKPVEGVTVLAENSLPFDKTDNEGRVTVRNYGVGYRPSLAFGKEGYGWEIEDALTAIPDSFGIILKPGIVLEGTVLGPDGAPLPKAEVYWAQFTSTGTDDKGFFRFPPAGKGSAASLMARKWVEQGTLEGGARVTLSNAPIEKVTVNTQLVLKPWIERDGMANRAASEVSRVLDGALRSAIRPFTAKNEEKEEAKPAVKPAQLRGAIVDAQGKPVPNVELQLSGPCKASSPDRNTISDARGAFSAEITGTGQIVVGAQKHVRNTEHSYIGIRCKIVEGAPFEVAEGVDKEVRLVVEVGEEPSRPSSDTMALLTPKAGPRTDPTTGQLRRLAGNVIDENGKGVDVDVKVIAISPAIKMMMEQNKNSPFVMNRMGMGSLLSAMPTHVGRNLDTGESSFFIERLPEPPYVVEVRAKHYQARVLFPEEDFKEGDMSLVITLKKGPFPLGVSVWETVTGRPATEEAVAETELGDIIRQNERDYFFEALPERQPQSAPTAACPANIAQPESDPQWGRMCCFLNNSCACIRLGCGDCISHNVFVIEKGLYSHAEALFKKT